MEEEQGLQSYPINQVIQYTTGKIDNILFLLFETESYRTYFYLEHESGKVRLCEHMWCPVYSPNVKIEV